jgi:O-antigen ligase
MKMLANRNYNILLLPILILFVLVTGDSSTLFRTVVARILPVCFILLYVLQYRFSGRINYLQILFCIYILWALVSAVFSHFPLHSIMTVCKMIVFCAFVGCIYLWTNTEKKIFILLNTLVISGWVLFFAILLQEFFLYETDNRIGGVYSNVNTSGFIFSMLIISTYILYILKKRIIYLISLIFFYFPLLATGSRAALIIAIGTFIFLLSSKYVGRKITNVVIFGSIILMLGISYRVSIVDKYLSTIPYLRVGAGDAGRQYLWKSALNITKDYPVLGIGSGNLKFIAPNYISKVEGKENWRRSILIERAAQSSHNMYLDVGAETGIIGLIVFVLILMKIGSVYKHYLNISDKNIKKLAHILFYLTIAVAIRGLFEPNGFFCKGWLSTDIVFWLLYIMFIRYVQFHISQNVKQYSS